MGPRNSKEIAELLEEIARHLEAEGANEAYSYRRAANTIRHEHIIPANPAELHGVGESLRDDIETLRVTGSLPRLEELRKRHPYLNELTRVDGIGPKTAEQINEAIGVSSIGGLIENADRLTEVHGIGEKSAEKILSSAERLKQ